MVAVAPDLDNPIDDRDRKIREIFFHFDENQDGRLSREEMAILVAAVNPRVKFSDEQISAILDQVFKTYGEYIDADKGLSLEGLRRTYDDGAGDVDRDFDSLGLALPPPDEPVNAPAEPSPEEPSTVSTRILVEDLEIVLRRHEKTSADGVTAVAPSAALSMDLADLRGRADAEPPEAAFAGHMAMGRTLLRRNLPADAVLSFQRAVSFNPGSARAHFLCGNAFYGLGQLAEAKEEFSSALDAGRADPQASSAILPQAHVNLGVVLEEEGMLMNACEQYREAALLNPQHFKTLKLLGSALLGLGETGPAAVALQNALYLNPDYPDAHCDLATTWHALGEGEKAREEFENTLRLQPDHVQALYNLGGLQRDSGQFEAAAETYSRVLEIEPRNWRAELNRAVALLGCKRGAEAEKGFQKALRMTNRVEVYDSLRQLKYVSRQNKKLSGVMARVPSKKEHGEPVLGVGAGQLGFEPAPSLVVEENLFKVANKKTSTPREVGQALEIFTFQRIAHLSQCDVRKLQQPLLEAGSAASGSGKVIRKAALEIVIRRLLDSLLAEPFQHAVRALNGRLVSPLDRNGTLDLALFLACLAPLCAGSLDQRKAAAFAALRSRGGEDRSGISVREVHGYIDLLKAVYLVDGPVVDVPSSPTGGDVSLERFSEQMDEHLAILAVVHKLEVHQRLRHNDLHCAGCAFPVVGLRYREMRRGFNLCARCYSDRRVPAIGRSHREYTFKEHPRPSEPLRERLIVALTSRGA